MTLLNTLASIVGPGHVLTGADCAKWAKDWTGKHTSEPLAVVRPATTAEVSQVLAAANAEAAAIVPVSGNTGLAGGAAAQGAIMLSVDRMNAIRSINTAGQTATVEAGVVLSTLHEAVEEHGLVFPLTFGARGTAMVGGFLSTNAGGSNVVRYGNTRALCMGVEVVLADGRVMNLMSELHKDNSGLDLRNLVVGAEGTLGIITAAVLKLFPKPKAYATATVAVPSLPDALTLLRTMQERSGGAVEAFEYMPRRYIESHLKMFPDARAPFEGSYDTNILIELGATAPSDAQPAEDGSIPIISMLEDTLGELMEGQTVLDAVIAQNDAQRAEMWARREAAGEIAFGMGKFVNTDVCVPVDQVETFLTRAKAAVASIDPGAWDNCVAHLGDGNIHYTVYPKTLTPHLESQITEAVEDIVQDLRGSFSAEHGIGIYKLDTMRRRKDPVALDVMRAIKTALDPKGILNPGKVIPSDSK